MTELLEQTEMQQRRTAARATLGVTGEAGAGEALRPVLREHGLTMYPLVALGLLSFADAFQSQGLAILSPELGTTLGLGIGAVTLARSLQFIATVIAPMPMAALSQRRNRVWLCIGTGVGWSVITLYTGFITSLLGLIVVLAFDGLSTGSVSALHGPLIADSYPPRARLRIFSAYGAFAAATPAVTPLLISLLAGPLNLSWRGVFVTLGAVSTGISLLSIGLKEPGRGRFDTEKLRAEGHVDDEAVSLGFFEIVRRLMLIPTIQRLSAGFLVFGMMLVPLQTFLSYFLAEKWDLTPSGRGLLFAFMGVVSVAALLLYGKRAEADFRRDPAAVITRISYALLIGITAICLGAVVPVFVVMAVLFAVGEALIYLVLPGLNGVITSIVEARQRPHVAALLGLFLAGGSILGLLLLGNLDSSYGITGSIIGLFVPGFVGSMLVRRARHTVIPDMDRMIDAILEEQDLVEITAAGGRLPMLSSRGINFSYGQLQVLFDVDFTVDEGEMVALLGTNGAGKSTLLKVISGIGLPQSGTVRMQGHDITYLDAERRLKLGITQIPGGRAVFGPMNVIDNLRAYGYTLGANKKAVDESIDRCLAAFPRLAERRTSLAATLSGGEQQMLGLSKALMLKPKLLLIDELSLGLAPVIVGQLLDMVREINAEGTAVVLVEQSVNIALSLVNHAYFMEKGQMRFDGKASELLDRADLLRAVFLEGATGNIDAAASAGAETVGAAL